MGREKRLAQAGTELKNINTHFRTFTMMMSGHATQIFSDRSIELILLCLSKSKQNTAIRVKTAVRLIVGQGLSAE